MIQSIKVQGLSIQLKLVSLVHASASCLENLTFLHFFDRLLLFINGSSEKSENNTSLRVNTNGCYNHFSTSFHDMSSRQEHWVKMFSLFHVIGFTSKWWFINLKQHLILIWSFSEVSQTFWFMAPWANKFISLR